MEQVRIPLLKKVYLVIYIRVLRMTGQPSHLYGLAYYILNRTTSIVYIHGLRST